MKPSKEKLYDALGELIYAVAKADGLIQPSETKKLHELLLAHPWAREIQWSFDYENRKKVTVEEAYEKALETCKNYGPSEEYAFLFEVLRSVAQASHGIDAKERSVIRRFKRELREHFLTLDFDDVE
jgi:tellurite resistance protein